MEKDRWTEKKKEDKEMDIPVDNRMYIDMSKNSNTNSNSSLLPLRFKNI